MNERPLLERIAPFLLAFYALSFLAFFAYAFITFSTSVFLPSMRWEYGLKRSFVLFMDYLIPVHAAGIAVAASLAGGARGPRAAGAPPQPFSKVVSSTLVTVLILAAVYTVLFEGVEPGARKRLSDMQYQSRLARLYLSQAEAATKSNDFRAALDAVDRYLAIDPGNRQVADQKLSLVAPAAKQAAPAPGPVVAGQPAASAGESAQALVEKAQFYFDRQDWFSAHYYAQAAASLDPRRTDAQRLASLAWERLGGVAASAADAKTAELFQQKKDAYALLVGGNPLAAYYRFVDLAARNPKDQDIAAYLSKAGAAVAATTFFLDEARGVEALPGTQRILFRNAPTPATAAGGDTGDREAVYIGKMVELTSGETFFFDIEAIRYDAAGGIAWHFGAPYGKRDGNSILMHCVDRTDPNVQFLPVYLQGSRPAAERAVLAVLPSVEEMRALSLNRDALSVMGLGELWRLRADLGSFGLSRQSLDVDMTMKILMPFAFLILSIFAASLGWGFRARYLGRPSLVAIILMPLVPVVLAVLSLLYVHAHRIIVGFTVIAFGFTAALIVMAVLQLLILSVALVSLAGQSTH